MTSLGSWETRKRQFGEGVSGGLGLEIQSDDSNTRIYTHGSAETAPETMPGYKASNCNENKNWNAIGWP